MEESEKTILILQNDVNLLKEEVADLKSQTKINSDDIQDLNINIVKLSGNIDGFSKDMKIYSDNMKDLAEQLKSINSAPREFNEKVKIGAVVAFVTVLITAATTAVTNYLFKR